MHYPIILHIIENVHYPLYYMQYPLYFTRFFPQKKKWKMLIDF